MRLTCPNCSAQYEVPDDVIPEAGRDVQCSNCNQTWFQPKHPGTPVEAPEPTADDVSTPESETPPEPVAESPEPEETADAVNEPEADTPSEPDDDTSNVDPAVASILREEAEREADLRAKEGVSLESQPDFPLEPPAEPKVEAKEPAATATSADAGQKDALPDVEAINSGLRSDETPTTAETTLPARRKSGGFMRGFALIVIIGVLLILIYGNARTIGEAVPQADPVLQSYVSLVDQARLWLEAQSSGAQ
ncbi:zinc-ribbon domain-containing protein [Ruegeria sp.]|uniref:zinc-ribbon domain-containing protein n=1 Tax=Ruegeria sp. TaxID=1879320 RepID=UPI003C7A0FC5